MSIIGKEVLNYLITSEIGKGGMGTVYLAQNKNMQADKVAIKMINSSMVNDFTKQRLKEEAEILQKLSHTNIVGFKTFHIDKDDNVYLIMEYAEGLTLEDYIRKKHGLVVEKDSEEIFAPILDAFAYAHKQGVLHRDIKPSNIIITETEDKDGKKIIVPKILDFGIAKIFSKDNVAKEELFMGTPSYMSPEQIKMEDLDERSDVYSLGVLLYHILTGKPPYDTSTMTEQQIEESVVAYPLKRMKEYYPYISAKIQAIVDKATSKDKQSRYKNCTEFKESYIKALRPMFSLRTKIVAAITMLLIVAVSLYIWDYNRTKIYYYKDYVEQWGIPQGVGKVSKSKHSHMQRSYKFEYRKRKLQRVSHVNSLDKIIDDGESERAERPIDQQFYYAENGNVSRIKVKDRNGKVLYVKAYNDKLNTMCFQYDDEHGTERFIATNTFEYNRVLEDEGSQKSRISRYWIVYDENGYVKTVKYKSLDSSPASDENGIYGVQYKRDDKGRVTELQYLNIDEQPTSTKWGLSIKRFSYDKHDNWVKSVYLTIDRKPAFDISEGTSIYCLEYDKYSNVIYQLHQDGKGNPMIPKYNGIAGVHNIYNDKGFKVTTEFLGLDKKPMFVQNTGVAITKEEYDKNGYVVKTSYYDTRDKKVVSTSGNSVQEMKNDENGNILEAWFYDDKNNLVNNLEGYAGIKFEYDSIGNNIKTVFYGKDKQPTVSKEGNAGFKQTFNDKNQIITFTNLGKDLHPMADIHNIISVVREYDAKGNNIKTSFMGAAKKNLRLSDEGIAGWNDVYDDRGNHIERNFFGIEGQPILPPLGYAKVVYEYDQSNNLVRYRYFDLNNKLVLVRGISGEDFTCDKSGNILENKPIGPNGELAHNRLIQRFKYDKYGNVIESSLHKASGAAALNSNNIHKCTYVYNSKNDITEERYYGTDGKLILCVGNFAIVKYKYDERGLCTETSFYGEDEKPIKKSEGFSVFRREYNQYGFVTKEMYFDVDGKPTDPKEMPPMAICQYDNRGNMIYRAAQDVNGQFICYKGQTWSIERFKYNERNYLVEELYYDVKDKPVLTDGYHKSVVKYDNYNRPIEWAFYDTQGKPATCKSQGYHKIVKTYKNNGDTDMESYYSVVGKLLLKLKYDNNGNYKVITNQNHNTHSSYKNWRDYLNDLKRNLPVPYYWSGANIISIDYSSSFIRMIIKFVRMSENDFSQEQIRDLKGESGKETIKNFVKEIGIPSSIYVLITFVDKNGKYIASVQQ